MTQRILCRTQFDITVTGVRSNFTRNRMPFQAANDQWIRTDTDWHRARNQQRNWETVNQIISLRALPTDISDPVLLHKDSGKVWQFEFVVEPLGVMSADGDPLGALKQDCVGVPMITGLTETPGLDDCLRIDHNIVFEMLDA